jgi:hypothetical protein
LVALRKFDAPYVAVFKRGENFLGVGGIGLDTANVSVDLEGLKGEGIYDS